MAAGLLEAAMGWGAVPLLKGLPLTAAEPRSRGGGAGKPGTAQS